LPPQIFFWGNQEKKNFLIQKPNFWGKGFPLFWQEFRNLNFFPPPPGTKTVLFFFFPFKTKKV